MGRGLRTALGTSRRWPGVLSIPSEARRLVYPVISGLNFDREVEATSVVFLCDGSAACGETAPDYVQARSSPKPLTSGVGTYRWQPESSLPVMAVKWRLSLETTG